jgi:hypothetical protein
LAFLAALSLGLLADLPKRMLDMLHLIGHCTNDR